MSTPQEFAVYPDGWWKTRLSNGEAVCVKPKDGQPIRERTDAEGRHWLMTEGSVCWTQSGSTTKPTQIGAELPNWAVNGVETKKLEDRPILARSNDLRLSETIMGVRDSSQAKTATSGDSWIPWPWLGRPKPSVSSEGLMVVMAILVAAAAFGFFNREKGKRS